jgi:hypothetical protein
MRQYYFSKRAFLTHLCSRRTTVSWINNYFICGIYSNIKNFHSIVNAFSAIFYKIIKKVNSKKIIYGDD